MASIRTPCVQICELDPARRLCRGCGRSVHEIGRWLVYSDDERERIMAELPARLTALTAASARA